MVELIHSERFYKGKNVEIAYIWKRNLKVFNLIDPEEHIILAKMSKIKFFSRTVVPVVSDAP